MISSPHFTPSPITPKIRFASTAFPSFAMVMLHGNAAASFTSAPAGLAWIDVYKRQSVRVFFHLKLLFLLLYPIHCLKISSLDNILSLVK